LEGDQISQKDVEIFKIYFASDCILVNGLGATECGLVRQYFNDKEVQITGNNVPVGYAVEDTKVLLFDDDGKEVGASCVGEIAVKSRYLSPGYWRRPDPTRARFLPDPNGGNELIYLTGDLGRIRPDGCLEYLGRRDFQVKIRGFRVEVTEVETVLLEHTNVRESTVVAQEGRFSDKRLVAYLVPSKKPGPSTSELRSLLKEKLPDYMIPSVFVMLDTLPLTPAGKVDRKALPFPSSARPELDTSFVAPTTPVEEELAKIWAEVLSLDQVGIQDNFFDLGGHSLLATQVISRVINTFKVELPIKSLFESPTVADMTVVITENMAKKAGDEDLTRMLTELESLSDEEAQRLLSNQSKRV
jgi:acyl carrier protein